MLLEILLPQQHFGDMFLFELKVDESVVGFRTLANRSTLMRKQQPIQSHVIELVRQRPGELGDLGPGQIVEDRARGNPAGSSRHGCEFCEVKVLTPSIARFGRLAYPMRMKVTTYVLLGWKSHRCWMATITVGAVRVASKTGGLNVRNDDGPENPSR
jgi:hypothetical protein